MYIGITASMSLALSACILFILLMQSVNVAQFLNITSFTLFLLPVFAVVLVPLISIYMSL